MRKRTDSNEEVVAACDELKAEVGLGEFVGQSPGFVAVVERIPVIARTDVAVLIQGETGTGKELCARAIHYLSARAGGPFVIENCGRLPAELIPNEFFGHESGAFTGATAPSKGLIGQAQGGTLVLDEIDSLPLSAQSVSLRFLQDKCYQRLGGQEFHTADVRILACTNIDLAGQVEKGLFRRDLFHRLKVLHLVLPSLRERATDIELLAAHFVRKYARKFQRPVHGLTPACVTRLGEHKWPGNVRELEDVIQQAVLFSTSEFLLPQDLNLPESKPDVLTPPQTAAMPFKAAKSAVLKHFEVNYLSQTLQAAGGNISMAARASGLNAGTMWHLLQKHHLLSHLTVHADLGESHRSLHE
jgi:DNA-binding NtrC family response regulator